MLIAGGQDLLILFLGLELLVLPGYLLAGFAKRDGLSTEGAIKYFLLGSFSSAILLFGLAFVLGFTGSTQLVGHRRGAGGHRRRQPGAAAGPGHGPRPAGGRRALQDRRRALPLLDAGRLPGLAHAGHGLPLGGPQGRRLRAHPAPLRGGPRAAARRVGRHRRRAGRRDHDGGQPGGAGPGQHQAHAGLLVDRPHRLHHGRPRRLRHGARRRPWPWRASRACSSTPSPTPS